LAKGDFVELKRLIQDLCVETICRAGKCGDYGVLVAGSIL